MKVKLIAFDKLEAIMDVRELRPEIRLAHVQPLYLTGMCPELDSSVVSNPGPMAGVFELDWRTKHDDIPVYIFKGLR